MRPEDKNTKPNRSGHVLLMLEKKSVQRIIT